MNLRLLQKTWECVKFGKTIGVLEGEAAVKQLIFGETPCSKLH